MSGDNLFLTAGERLEGADSVPLVLSPLLLQAVGLRKGYGTVAYYEWKRLDRLLAQCRSALLAQVGGDEAKGPELERWLREPGRTVGQVRVLLEQAAGKHPEVTPIPITLRPGLVRMPQVARARLPRVLGVALETLRQRGDGRSLAGLLVEASSGAEFGTMTSSEWLGRLDELIDAAGIRGQWARDEATERLMEVWRSEHAQFDVIPNQGHRLGRFLELVAGRIDASPADLSDGDLVSLLSPAASS